MFLAGMAIAKVTILGLAVSTVAVCGHPTGYPKFALQIEEISAIPNGLTGMLQ
jgi:hypothetical protein